MSDADDKASRMETNVQTRSSESPYLGAGEIRRFGLDGVLYEIIGNLEPGRLLIRVLDTGEETTYPMAKALTDPRD